MIKNTKNLLIVAHADDEVIWAGEMLLKEKRQWDIICVVEPDNQSKFRIPIFNNLVSNYLECNTKMLSFQDYGYGSNIVGDVESALLSKIMEKKWDKILTHGNKGEYGHSHHIQVHNIVKKIIIENNLIDCFWTFNPVKKTEKLELSENKQLLFANTYDDESNLPIGHPKKWVHGWNTTMGWVEGFEKFSIK